ncbi:MAG: DUF3488 domain-containing transglutaminase family protein [bacterium]|nr:DUF3488 domain-containing transglutaminase family protein [bacterium]
MRFLLYFRLSNYLLVASGFLALLITDEYGPGAALLFGALLVGGWLVDAGKLKIRLPQLVLNLATLLFLIFCVVDVLYLRHIIAIGLVNFLVVLQATKLLFPKKDRDYVIIYILSFFELLISSIMTFSVLFALSCLAFIVTGSWALITLHLKQEIQEHILHKRMSELSPSGENATAFNLPVLNSLVNLRFFSGTFVITLVTCLLSLLVFLIVPRVQEGYFFRYGRQRFSQKVSGFSDEVVLDSFGIIRQDHTPVMQVELPQIVDLSTLPGKLYWKGVSYNFYDGQRWRSDEFEKKAHPWPLRRYQAKVWLRKANEPETLIRQNVKLLSNQFKVIFAVNRLHGVEGRFYHLQYDEFTENVEAELNQAAPQYSAYSDMNRASEQALRADHQVYPDEIRRVYLQTPELSDRISTLAAGLRRDTASSYDMAVVIREYLQQNYQYSLQVQRSSGLLPLEDFLFVNKAGHCEYYATSMTILLRISGVPARVVNGFAQGRWNEFGRFFTVRQSDAHAWVEVFFPSYGWVPFDPTPASAFGEGFQQFAEQSGVLARLYRYSEYMRTKWNHYVIDYTIWEQANLAINAFYATRSTHAKLSTFARRVKALVQRNIQTLSVRRAGLVLAVALTGGGLVLLLLRMFPGSVLRFPGWQRRVFPGRNGQVRFYKRMLSILARKGILKASSATPGEFAVYISENYPIYMQEVKDMTQFYYAVRYGGRMLANDEILQVENLLRRLRQRSHNPTILKRGNVV